jgi:hypothetical protein
MGKYSSYGAFSTIDPANDKFLGLDVSDPSLGVGGTEKLATINQLLAAGGVLLDSTATDIQPDGVQAAGSTGKYADAGHVHPAGGNWLPGDNGFQAVNWAPHLMNGNTVTVAGNLYVLKVPVRSPFTATNLVVNVQTGGTGASTQSFAGLYNSSGTLLTGSSDVGSLVTATGFVTLPLTTPQSLTPSGVGGFVWAALVFNLATTQPNLRGLPSPGSTGATIVNLNTTNATAGTGIGGTSITALANITPASINKGGNTTAYWIGVT